MFPRQTLQSSVRSTTNQGEGNDFRAGEAPFPFLRLKKLQARGGGTGSEGGGRRRVSISLHVKAARRRRIQKAATRQRIVGERCLKVTVDPAKREKILFPGAKVSQSVGCGGRGGLDRLRLRLWLGLRRGDVNREKRKDFRV